VRNEKSKASTEGRRVISQSVTIQTSCCPECGRSYVSGGKTTTVTASEKSSDESRDPNRILDLFA
jgi:hypothetical protein